jgi:hypothetical protein
MLRIMKFRLLGYIILFIFVRTKIGIPRNDFNKMSVKISTNRELWVFSTA